MSLDTVHCHSLESVCYDPAGHIGTLKMLLGFSHAQINASI